MARRTVDLEKLLAVHEALQTAVDALADTLPAVVDEAGERTVPINLKIKEGRPPSR